MAPIALADHFALQDLRAANKVVLPLRLSLSFYDAPAQSHLSRRVVSCDPLPNLLPLIGESKRPAGAISIE
jgi:hypothetical protein